MRVFRIVDYHCSYSIVNLPGGDDVQQLCEAGEEEFLEIMALVGMACKPLHVRRLQKSLQEWVTRPALFRSANVGLIISTLISFANLFCHKSRFIICQHRAFH